MLYPTFDPSATISFGLSGDIPATGDYTGDGVTDWALFRPSNGTWQMGYLTGPARPYCSAGCVGAPGDVPVPAGYDGDGVTDLGVYTPATGRWTSTCRTAGRGAPVSGAARAQAR